MLYELTVEIVKECTTGCHRNRAVVQWWIKKVPLYSPI